MEFKGIIKTAEKPEEHNVIYAKNFTALQLKVYTRTGLVFSLSWYPCKLLMAFHVLYGSFKNGE